MNLSIIGSGYVGLVTGACFADVGHNVICVDNDESKVESLQHGKVPIYEPGLEEIVHRNVTAQRLRFTSSIREGVENAEVIFIAVPTPQDADGSVDLSFIEKVAREIAGVLTDYRVIVDKSTVPVKTGEKVAESIKRYNKHGSEFDVVSNPEFLREGCAVADLMKPDRIVIGAQSERAIDLMKKVYEPFMAPILVTDINSAELIKHAANSFLALKISYINAVSAICEASGADVEKVADGIGMDRRIGRNFLNAGIGYGGSCFPKDIAAFIAISEQLGVPFNLLKEVQRINAMQKERFLKTVRDALWVLRDKKIAVWGLTFKPDTDDIRSSVALELVAEMLREGAQVTAYDPKGMEKARALKSIAGARLTNTALEAMALAGGADDRDGGRVANVDLATGGKCTPDGFRRPEFVRPGDDAETRLPLHLDWAAADQAGLTKRLRNAAHGGAKFMKESGRTLALAALDRWRRGREFADKIVAEIFRDCRLGAADRAFALELFYGALRNLTLLDFWIAKLRPAPIELNARDILRIGLYQILLIETAAHAAVFETVELARPRTRPLINAMLRRALREKASLTQEEEEQLPQVRFSTPEFLIAKWSRRFGIAAALELCQWNNRPAPVYARINRLKTTTEEFLRRYAGSFLLPGRSNFVGLPDPTEVLRSADCYIQDPSTAIACEMVRPEPGESVLDACAAPGGKSAYLAEMMRNAGMIVAADQDETRLERLRGNLVRLGVTNARTVRCDWSNEDSVRGAALAAQSFDKILLDAPCTNTGVMRRRVDLRWRLRPEDFARMQGVQLGILRAVQPLLRPGGSLVYSTCSLEPEENDEVINAFLRAYPNFRLTNRKKSLPFRDSVDGACAARLEFLP